MVPIGTSHVSRPRRSSPARGGGSEDDSAVVSLRGEHDLSTAAALSETIAQAIALDDAGVVIDLSEAQFISAATIGVIVQARGFLGERGRSLAVRSASPFARRIFEACGLAEFLDPSQTGKTAAPSTPGALATWVSVPPASRAPEAESEVPESIQQREDQAQNVVGLGGA